MHTIVAEGVYLTLPTAQEPRPDLDGPTSAADRRPPTERNSPLLWHKCRLGRPPGRPASRLQSSVPRGGCGSGASTSAASPGRLPEGFPERQNPGQSLLREQEVAAVQSPQGLTRQSPCQHLGHLPADNRPGAKHLAQPPQKKN